MSADAALFATALAFAFIAGVNDGGSVLSLGLTIRSVRPLTAVLLLTLALVGAPLLIGTQVATTLASRLVPLEGVAGQWALMIAVIVAVVVTAAAARRGLPTSLTLALVGAVAGAGAGSGLPVSWGTVGAVLLAAALAPVVGMAVGWLLTRAARWVRPGPPLHRRLPRWHVAAYGLQCLAYGANDGQKLVAVAAVASAPVVGPVRPVGWQLAAIAVLFLVGAVVGLPRLARTLGSGVVPVQPPDAVIAELSSATAVLGMAAIGSPVSMTQVVAGSLLGGGITRGHGRVRWVLAARIAAAWVLTMPASTLLAATAAAVVRSLTA